MIDIFDFDYLLYYFRAKCKYDGPRSDYDFTPIFSRNVISHAALFIYGFINSTATFDTATAMYANFNTRYGRYATVLVIPLFSFSIFDIVSAAYICKYRRATDICR